VPVVISLETNSTSNEF